MMKIRIWLIAAIVGCFMAPAYAETFFIDCNLEGLDPERLTEEMRERIFWNRLADRGVGNGGESADITVDVVTGDIFVTCISTPDEETGGTLSVQLPDGTIIPIGPFFAEADPGESPVPETPAP